MARVKLGDEEQREINAERSRTWRAANPKKVSEQAKMRREVNPERARGHYRAWAKANPEKVRERARVRRKANPERARKQSRAWRAANQERVREQVRLRRAANPDKEALKEIIRRGVKKQATPSWADSTLIRAIYLQAKTLSKTTGTPYHVDHIIPLKGVSVSGLHVQYNLRVSTAKENLSKNNKLDHALLALCAVSESDCMNFYSPWESV